MIFRWTPSCDKDGISRLDAVHAIRHAVAVVDPFGAPRVEGRPLRLFVGPTRAGGLLEVWSTRPAPTGCWCST